jgi:predicted nucleotidyltransferase
MANISQKWLNKEFEILSVFGNIYNKRARESEIVEITKMPQRTVSRKLNQLAKNKILDFVNEGKNKIYFLRKDNPLMNQILVFIENYKTFKFLNKNEKLSFILEKIKEPCLLFGSYSKGNHDKDSDIDLAVFSDNNRDIEKSIALAPFEVHVQFSSLDKFKEDLKNKNPLTKEIANNHIIINGVDNLIKIFSEYYW